MQACRGSAVPQLKPLFPMARAILRAIWVLACLSIETSGPERLSAVAVHASSTAISLWSTEHLLTCTAYTLHFGISGHDFGPSGGRVVGQTNAEKLACGHLLDLKGSQHQDGMYVDNGVRR